MSDSRPHPLILAALAVGGLWLVYRFANDAGRKCIVLAINACIESRTDDAQQPWALAARYCLDHAEEYAVDHAYVCGGSEDPSSN